MNRSAQNANLSGEFLNEVFHRYPSLDDRDRSFVNQLVRGVLRWRLRLDWIIKQFADRPFKTIDSLTLNILRMALFQILFLDRIPESAAVNEAVNLAREDKSTQHKASFINGILRHVCRRKKEIPLPNRDKDIVRHLSIVYSYPLWLVKKWIRELGVAGTEDLLSSQNSISDLNIRVNTLRIDRSGLMDRLIKDGVTGERTRFAPEGMILKAFKGRVDELSSFKEGLLQVQDQAAQIVSHLLSPRPEDRVLDICAGLGGKSTHMAQMMEGQGRIVALDINPSRLVKLGRNARRLGVDIIAPVVADASRTLSTVFRCSFNRIMVDPPCSGLGVLSRHPDGKWNRSEDDIKRLARIQKAILKEAASVLGNEGRLLYVTCTISKDENEDVVEDLLDSNKDIILEDLRGQVPEWGKELIDDRGFYKSLPHIHHMDGFFGALFVKR